MNILRNLKSIMALFVSAALIMALSACSKEAAVEREMTPKDIFYEIMTLTKNKDYNAVAEYCRSFSPYSVELYFSNTDTDFDPEWTAEYSKLLYSLFENHVTYKNVTEDFSVEERSGTVTATFTSLDAESFNDSIEYKINTEYKNDFDGQMKYMTIVSESREHLSQPFKLDIEFRYTNGEWQLAEKNFLLLLTLGYYAQQQTTV